MDNNTLFSLLALIVSAITLLITFYDRIFKKAKCKINVEVAMFSKNENRWRVYIRLNVKANNKPITIKSISLSKIHDGKRWYITTFGKAYNGDAFAQAKNDFLLPNTILESDTSRRVILETKFSPNFDLLKSYGLDEKGWILSFSYNENSNKRINLNSMRILGKDKLINGI